mgnify:CR=1 FL=1
MAKKPGYNDESIVALKGKDRVRKKPAVIFGSSGIDGCEHSIFEIVSNSVDEAREVLEKINIVSTPFNEELITAHLHWMLSDRDYSITLECVQDGMKIYYTNYWFYCLEDLLMN